MGLFTRRIAVVVQALLDPEVAGVMFTKNPINGADERVIEAAWGLGEAVVAGRVPDHYRWLARARCSSASPAQEDRDQGLPDGGTREEEVQAELVESRAWMTPASRA